MARKKSLPTGVSSEDWAELEKKIKRANQRIASATPGQSKALEHYTKKVLGGPSGATFSRAIPQTRAEYSRRLSEVNRFLAGKTTTRRGWESLKKSNIEKAGKTLRESRGYDITDEELNAILQERTFKTRKEYYRAVDLVQAELWKREAVELEGKKDDRTLNQIVDEAMAQKLTAGEAIKAKLSAKRKLASAKDLRK